MHYALQLQTPFGFRKILKRSTTEKKITTFRCFHPQVLRNQIDHQNLKKRKKQKQKQKQNKKTKQKQKRV
jgi:hypothetical protein